MTKSAFVYVTYITTTKEKLWQALTHDSEFMKLYWFGMHCQSQWVKGSTWQMVRSDGSICDAGEIVDAVPLQRLVIRWQHQDNPELRAEGHSLCTIELEQFDDAVKLSITHVMDREGSKFINAVSGGWPKILSNLKSLLETGSVVRATAYPAHAKI